MSVQAGHPQVNMLLLGQLRPCSELTHARTSGLLDSLKVQVYGQKMPLRSAANVSVRDAQTLLVTAFDSSVRTMLVQLQFCFTGSSAEQCLTADGACY